MTKTAKAKKYGPLDVFAASVTYRKAIPLRGLNVSVEAAHQAGFLSGVAWIMDRMWECNETEQARALLMQVDEQLEHFVAVGEMLGNYIFDSPIIPG